MHTLLYKYFDVSDQNLEYTKSILMTRTDLDIQRNQYSFLNSYFRQKLYQMFWTICIVINYYKLFIKSYKSSFNLNI